ncbi:MAG: ABC transporter substrate binding protein [bacterium]
MELWIGALNLGFLYAFMTMGVYITFRIHDFPDITVDGSFTTGAAVAAVLIVSGVNPFLALLAAFAVGAAAGCVTALMHTRLNVNGLLAGILVMTGLYSINLHIMGRSNIPLLKQTTLFTYLEKINPGLNMEIWICLAFSVVMILFWLVGALFFKTDFGISMRITGNNPTMAAATGVNVDRMKIFGVALANALVGVSGGLVAQYQGFADIGMGIGTIVIGLAAVIVGESILRVRSMFGRVLSVIIGSVIFRLMIAVALYVGMNPIDLKLLTAGFVLITLIISKTVGHRRQGQETLAARMSNLSSVKRFGLVFTGLVLSLVVAVVGYRHSKPATTDSSKHYKIGFLQVSDNGLLNITRDSFADEMKKIGYIHGENCTILLENANGDLPTVNTILDKFLQEDMDIIVPISTACTQATVNKVKDRPVVFATVANPFIIGAGESETEHLPNVTGVYGWAPMDKTIAIVRRILPGKLKIGAIWDPAHANSVFNVENLQKVIEADEDLTFLGATITSSSEVYQAAQSLVQKGIDVFVLSPDNIVYSAFEGVVKAAKTKNIPIFISDVERLGDGALGALGYDYTISGIQAAHLVDRILKGENPKDLPFERYKKLTFGLNLQVAQEIGLSIPPDLLTEATLVYDTDGKQRVVAPAEGSAQPSPQNVPSKETRVVLFYFSDHSIITEAANGVCDELKESGTMKQHNISLDIKSAQGDLALAQSIAKDIVGQDYDYVISLTTPILQLMAQANKSIPQVFGAVTDPFRMGVANSPDDHIPNITGVATLQPVESTIKVMRELFPNAKRIGIVWNTGEACSEACTFAARKAAPKYNFELVEANVSSTGEVVQALSSILAKGIDVFITSGDNTVLMATESIGETLKRHKIPFFTNGPSDVEKGAFVSIGADYYQVGREVGKLAKRVMEGENPRDIPINACVPESMWVNLALAEVYGIKVPEEFLARAGKVLR